MLLGGLWSQSNPVCFRAWPISSRRIKLNNRCACSAKSFYIFPFWFFKEFLQGVFHIEQRRGSAALYEIPLYWLACRKCSERESWRRWVVPLSPKLFRCTAKFTTRRAHPLPFGSQTTRRPAGAAGGAEASMRRPRENPYRKYSCEHPPPGGVSCERPPPE